LGDDDKEEVMVERSDVPPAQGLEIVAEEKEDGCGVAGDEEERRGKVLAQWRSSGAHAAAADSDGARLRGSEREREERQEGGEREGRRKKEGREEREESGGGESKESNEKATSKSPTSSHSPSSTASTPLDGNPPPFCPSPSLFSSADAGSAEAKRAVGGEKQWGVGGSTPSKPSLLLRTRGEAKT